MASALQLPREELLRAYRQMRTIREFEETCSRDLHRGGSGLHASLCGRGGPAVGVCMRLDDRDNIASPTAGMAIASPRAAIRRHDE